MSDDITNDISRALIPRMREEWNGALVSRSRVVDGLLDLRSAAGSDPAVISIIDRALASMPGQNLVARDWAVDVLDRVDEQLRQPSSMAH